MKTDQYPFISEVMKLYFKNILIAAFSVFFIR